jgi:hypothetical protein
MIHTRDHGFPHVTVYHGTPEDHEAFAKVRLDEIAILEAEGFDQKTMLKILKTVIDYQAIFLEVWNETRQG